MRGNDFDFNNPDDIRRVMSQVREQVLRYRSWIFRGLLVVLVLLLFATTYYQVEPDEVGGGDPLRLASSASPTPGPTCGCRWASSGCRRCRSSAS